MTKIRESAKLNATRALAAYVPRALHALLSCLRCSRASLVIHAFSPHVSGALRVFVLFVPHSLRALLLLIPHLIQMFQV